MQYDSVIVRYGGEIGIKAEWTKRLYEKKLLKNIKKALDFQVVSYEKLLRRRTRLYVETDSAREVAEKLTRVFGISSVSPAKKTSSAMDAITETAIGVMSSVVEDGCSFAVRCRRTGKHQYSSVDVCKEVGKQILAELGKRNLRVDLDNPNAIINIEVREGEAYVFAETLCGSGGFPIGSQEKLVSLLSGGIDSPVASWLVMKRGCSIVPVYFDNSPLTDQSTTTKALNVARKLFDWSIGFPRRVYVVPLGENLEAFAEKAPRKLTCLLCKRMMYRIAEHIADAESAEGIVTGEAIGEQASQTITNLRVLNEAAAKYPVHRPLLGFDKTETEALARKIGTYEASIQKAKSCTAAPYQPATRARLAVVKEAEEGLDLVEMAERSLSQAKIVTV